MIVGTAAAVPVSDLDSTNAILPASRGSDLSETSIEVSPDELIDTARRVSDSGAPPVAGDTAEPPLTTPSGLLKTGTVEEPAVAAARGSNLRLALIAIAVLTAAATVISFLIMGR